MMICKTKDILSFNDTLLRHIKVPVASIDLTESICQIAGRHDFTGAENVDTAVHLAISIVTR